MSALMCLLTVPAPPCITSKGSGMLKSVVGCVIAATRARSSGVRSPRCASGADACAAGMAASIKEPMAKVKGPTRRPLRNERVIKALLKNRVGAVETVRPFDVDLTQLERRDDALET